MAFTVELTTTYETRRGITGDYRAVRCPNIPAAVAVMRAHWARVGRRHGTRLDVRCIADTGAKMFTRTISRPY